MFSPSACNIRHLTLSMLPSTFHPRIFTLTLDILPSQSTFYTRPRHLTLDSRLIDKLVLATLIYNILLFLSSTHGKNRFLTGLRP
jgi:hypothetical protein